MRRGRRICLTRITGVFLDMSNGARYTFYGILFFEIGLFILPPFVKFSKASRPGWFLGRHEKQKEESRMKESACLSFCFFPSSRSRPFTPSRPIPTPRCGRISSAQSQGLVYAHHRADRPGHRGGLQGRSIRFLRLPVPRASPASRSSTRF